MRKRDLAGGLEIGPVPVAAVDPPVGEVLFRDGAKVSGESGVDFGMGVKPGDEGFAGLAVAHAAVEFFGDSEREMGDFTVASHRRF